MVKDQFFDEDAFTWLNQNELSYTIWDKKYRYNNESLEHWFDRISHNDLELKELIRQKKFLFGGRILASRGLTDRKVTYSNCYVISPPDDNIESIFDCAKKLARTYSYGGGCGINISNLRPSGAIVNNAAKTTSGPVSFMDLYSSVTGVIGQSGRRGALMIMMDVNHPDIFDFVDAKKNTDKINFANISVKVNDSFMKAVENNEDYFLHWPCNKNDFNIKLDCEYNKLYFVTSITNEPRYYKKINARELFNKLVENNWDYAEPGILYWNKISEYNLLQYDKSFEYGGVNPCAEEPLPSGGSCLLGSLNLSEFVVNPFTPKAFIDQPSLVYATFIAVKALNTVLDDGQPLHPLKEQRDSVNNWRQIGLGTMGMADMLIKLGVTYGSNESINILEYVYKLIAENAVKASSQIAFKQKPYPEYKPNLLIKSDFIQNLNLDDRDLDFIQQYGLANSQLLTCAPTGSIATMLQVSTGVEPNFALSYTRKTQSLHGEDIIYKVEAGIIGQYRTITGDTSEELPEYFIESGDILPNDRIKVQSVLQKYTDAAISSTINLKNKATKDDVYNIYMNAWKAGLKGITLFRSGCKREAVLSTKPQEIKEIISTSAPKRPKQLPADYYQVKIKGEQFIVLVGLYENKPYEIFAFKPDYELKFKEHTGVITKIAKMKYSYDSGYLTIPELNSKNQNVEEKATTLYCSMLLRHGVDIKYIIKTATKVNDNITSFSKAICRVLAKYIKAEITGEKCPNCGSNLIYEGGCTHCESCEYSKCE